MTYRAAMAIVLLFVSTAMAGEIRLRSGSIDFDSLYGDGVSCISPAAGASRSKARRN